jgi:hypothetical protein
LTCPPASLRTRISKSKVERRTYVSTGGAQNQITLFHELSEGAPSSAVQTIIHKVEDATSPIIFLGTVAAVGPLSAPVVADVLAIFEDGEIRCFAGSNLEERWVSPAAALKRDVTSSFKEPKVEFVQLTNAFSACQGILRAHQHVMAVFPQEVTEEGFNPEILVLITRSGQDANTRTLHVINMPRRLTAPSLPGHRLSVESLLTARIPSIASTASGSRASFNIQASTGMLQQLDNEVLTTFDLSDSLPKHQSSFRVTGAHSFLRLTNTSILVSTDRFITVYNPKYRSILASVEIDHLSDSIGQKRKRVDEKATNGTPSQFCKFITYFPKLGSAVAITNNQLIGIQLEGQQDRQGRLRPSGLLIDSIGCSIKDQSRPIRDKVARKKSTLTDSLTLGSLLPGSVGQELPFFKEIAQIDALFSEGKMEPEGFDKAMLSFIGAEWRDSSDLPMANGATVKRQSSQPIVSEIDRRWAIYALSKIFAWSEDENAVVRLAIDFYPPQIFAWLLENGQMTVSNIEFSLRKYSDLKTGLPAGQLVGSFVELDRDMELLLGLLAKNHLCAAELLHAIRKLMESLGLLAMNPGIKQKLLTNGEESEVASGDVEDDIARLEAEIEKDLELAEYQLGPGSGVRGEGLSIALSKLYKSPNPTIVHTLQTTFSNQEVVSLIYLLRFELAKGAWTTKYTDIDEEEMIDEDAPENAIVLLASLLNNCIDAVGAGGWLLGEARLADDDPFEAEELIGSLKLEVSAALEGINEAVYLEGITSEMIRYSDGVFAALPRSKKRKDAPISLPSTDKDLITLPIGLKAEKQVSILKAGVGGTIHKRSLRDIGHQKSQKVGKYTRERIVV